MAYTIDLTKITQFDHVEFVAKQVVEGFITGIHKSPMHGFSVEFAEHRPYNTGEPIRHIDWKLYARTDKLFVKQYEEETNLRCQLLIDTSASMLFPVERQGDVDHPNKLTFAVAAAAVIAELLHRQRDAFGLTLFGDKVDLHTPCRSNSVHKRYVTERLDALLAENGRLKLENAVPNAPNTALAATLHAVAEQMHKRSLVVLFTDAFDSIENAEPLFDALRHLRHNKHEVIVVHTFERAKELQLDYDSRPYQFIDLETGRTVRLTPTEVAAAYSERMNTMQTDLQRHALQYRIEYVPVDVALGFHQVILPFLLKRNKI